MATSSPTNIEENRQLKIGECLMTLEPYVHCLLAVHKRSLCDYCFVK
jgi:hypothetical protein